MKLRTRILVIAAVIFGLIGVGAIAEQHVSALGDPVETVICDTTVTVGTPLHCTVTIDQPGFAPSNQKITYRNPRTGSTINVANSSVIPATFDGTTWSYTYTPSLGEVGRFEVFSVQTSCTRLGCRVTGSAGFTVSP